MTWTTNCDVCVESLKIRKKLSKYLPQHLNFLINFPFFLTTPLTHIHCYSYLCINTWWMRCFLNLLHPYSNRSIDKWIDKFMTSSQPRVIEFKRTGRLSQDQKAVHMQHNAVFRGERQISFICFPLSVAFGDFQSQAQTIFYLGIVAFRYRVFIKYCFFPKIFKIYSGLFRFPLGGVGKRVSGGGRM